MVVKRRPYMNTVCRKSSFSKLEDGKKLSEGMVDV